MAETLEKLSSIFAPIRDLRREVDELGERSHVLRNERDTVANRPLPKAEVLQDLTSYVASRRHLLVKIVGDGLKRRGRHADAEAGGILTGMLQDLAEVGGLDKFSIELALRGDVLTRAIGEAFAAIPDNEWGAGLSSGERASKLEEIDHEIEEAENRLREIDSASAAAKVRF